MKVLHVIPSLSRADGGPTEALLLMERALRGQGLQVETATTDDAGPGQRNGKPLGEPLAENGATHWYFAKRTDFYKSAPGFARWISREARRFDLIHIHALFSFTSAAAARAARRAGVPYIVRPMGSLNAYGMTRHRPWLKRLSMRFIESSTLRHAAAVHFTSDAEAREARQWGVPLREVVIPLGVEDVPSPPPRTRDPSGASNALFLSRIDPKKNIEALLGAAAQLRGETPHLRWTLAGGGDAAYVARLQALAQELGVADRVAWLGHVAGEAKAHTLAQADLFVLPSFSENFGIAAAEALAAGLPCVLGEGVAIAQEVAAAGAGVAVAPDARSVAAGVRLIIGDARGHEAMAARARRLAAERFSAGAMGTALLALYSRILNETNEFPGSR
ncbi:glycosyltransferase [Caenimonas aquaedulcis]|uniref:Glycosyltransferase n=1 Tax=Caenimonas aquaedulcis TaxID=2793270 RepID=A0A931MHL1_9BURK|nr:glycosyltransferase [Caenimonas aquaedulcis]MBG9389057.1 glycosyltransferase [Caenimonas aquaedulcis]